MTRIIGLDISMTSTGVAIIAGAHATTQAITSRGHRGDDVATTYRRFTHITTTLDPLLDRVDLAVVEAPAYAALGGSTWDRAGLWWLIVDRLHRQGIPVATVPPKVRAKWATGSGNAGKQQVWDVAAAMLPGRTVRTDDEADALILAAMGAHYLGQITSQPAFRVAALKTCTWPALTEQAA